MIFDADGNMVTAPEDEGSFNMSDPENDKSGHFKNDVLPWIFYGNSEDDTTNMAERLWAFTVDGGISMAQGKAEEVSQAVSNGVTGLIEKAKGAFN